MSGKHPKVQRHTEVQVHHAPDTERRVFEIQERIVTRSHDLTDADLRQVALDIVTRSNNLRMGKVETSAHAICTDAEEMVRYMRDGTVPPAPVEEPEAVPS